MVYRRSSIIAYPFFCQLKSMSGNVARRVTTAIKMVVSYLSPKGIIKSEEIAKVNPAWPSAYI